MFNIFIAETFAFWALSETSVLSNFTIVGAIVHILIFFNEYSALVSFFKRQKIVIVERPKFVFPFLVNNFIPYLANSSFFTFCYTHVLLIANVKIKKMIFFVGWAFLVS